AVRVDRVLLDGPAAAATLAAFEARRGTPRSRAARDRIDRPRGAHPPHDADRRREESEADPARFLAVAGAEQPRAEQRRVAAFAAEHHWGLRLQPALAGLPSVVAADEGLIGSGDIIAGTRADTGSLGGLGCAALR